MAGKKGPRRNKTQEAFRRLLRHARVHQPEPGRLLVAAEELSPLCLQELELGDHQTALWSRYCWDAQQGSPWPPDQSYDWILLRLPRSKDAQQMILECMSARLSAGGQIWLMGAKHEGIVSAGKQLDAHFDQRETLTSAGHGRIWTARGREGGEQRPAMEDFAIDEPSPLPPHRSWRRWPGTFARGVLDEGSALLLSTLDRGLRGRVLDFACGTGLLTEGLRQRFPGLRVWGLDADTLALEAARRNHPELEFYASDGWRHAPDQRYRWIISNPPIHRGWEDDRQVLRALIQHSPRYLVPGGTLQFVVQRTVPVRRDLEQRYHRVKLVQESSRFRVWSAGGPKT